MKLSLVCGRALQVENCLTTKAVQSEQYIEEVKTMKSFMLQQCPHLARWGLGPDQQWWMAATSSYSVGRDNCSLVLLVWLAQRSLSSIMLP